MTEIQEKVIPYLLDTDIDLIGLAQTGTGKTAAFGIPLIQKAIINDSNFASIILCPTRELCKQIATDIEDYVRQALQEAPKAGFEWLVNDASDWRTPWQDWASTRYEIKALREKRTPHYLTFVA